MFCFNKREEKGAHFYGFAQREIWVERGILFPWVLTS
jgi:hypothetical protein